MSKYKLNSAPAQTDEKRAKKGIPAKMPIKKQQKRATALTAEQCVKKITKSQALYPL